MGLRIDGSDGLRLVVLSEFDGNIRFCWFFHTFVLDEQESTMEMFIFPGLSFQNLIIWLWFELIWRSVAKVFLFVVVVVVGVD